LDDEKENPMLPTTTDELLCEECGHKVLDHDDPYGCQHEGPDIWIEGTNCGGLVASGPCGCKHWTPEEVLVAVKLLERLGIEKETRA
jgi:hypothetical protein